MEPNQQGAAEPVRSDETIKSDDSVQNTQNDEIAENQRVVEVVAAHEIEDDLIQPHMVADAVADAVGAYEFDDDLIQLHVVADAVADDVETHETEDDDEKTIVEPLERPLKDQSDSIMIEITIEDAQQFADYMYQKMIEAWNDETNRLASPPAGAFDEDEFDAFRLNPNNPPWLTHLSKECDCSKWLYIEFPQVREDTVKRLFDRSGPSMDVHNTLVVAIYAYCIQMEILKRPEFEAFYKKLESSDQGLDEWTWTWLLKLIQYPYAGRRLKKNRMDFEPKLVTEAKVRYEAFITELHAKFPFFFEEDGVLRKLVFESANPGRTFDCVRCQDKFAVRYGVHCKAQDITDENAGQEDENSAHHMCRKCFRFILSGEFELTLQGANIPCFKEGCTSHIEPDSVSKYLHRATRKYLEERTQKREADV